MGPQDVLQQWLKCFNGLHLQNALCSLLDNMYSYTDGRGCEEVPSDGSSRALTLNEQPSGANRGSVSDWRTQPHTKLWGGGGAEHWTNNLLISVWPCYSLSRQLWSRSSIQQYKKGLLTESEISPELHPITGLEWMQIWIILKKKAPQPKALYLEQPYSLRAEVTVAKETV